MGEQNRRTLDLEARSTPAARHSPRTSAPPRSTGVETALSPEADERQTLRQAPPTAAPGESAEGDGVG